MLNVDGYEVNVLDLMIFSTLGRLIYILDSSNSSSFKFLVSLLLVLEATEPVSEQVTQMALKAYVVSAKILNWHSLRHSHSADICIHFYCLS